MKSTILVCDDDESTRLLIREALLLRGFAVELAEDGLAAKSECEQKSFDLVIIDILMPRMSGIEFVRWLRSADAGKWTPVLMVTALDDVIYRVEGLESGADDYLGKPFQLQELEARVSALLRTKKLMDELNQRNEELRRSNDERDRLQKQLLERERALVAAQLAGATAHELLQPVTTLSLSLHQLQSFLKLLEPGSQTAAQRIVDDINSHCREMKTIIDRLPTVDATQQADYVGGEKILSIK